MVVAKVSPFFGVVETGLEKSKVYCSESSYVIILAITMFCSAFDIKCYNVQRDVTCSVADTAME